MKPSPFQASVFEVLLLLLALVTLPPNPAAAALTPAISSPIISVGPGTYPRATTLSNNSILLVCEVHTSSTTTLTVSRSTDRGQTWAQIGTIAQAPTGTQDLANPFPVQLPSGRLVAAFRNHDLQDGVYTHFRITLCYSDDSGRTWKYLSTAAEEPGPVHGLWEPFLRVADDGSLQIYYSQENASDDQDSLMRTSPDGGTTWSDPKTISGGDRTARDGMLGVAGTDDSGGLIAVFESSSQNGRFAIEAVFSPDDGRTWGGRRRVYTASGEANNAGAPQVISVNGSLVCSFMTDEDTQRHEWIQGAGAKLVVSEDGGRSWSDKLDWSPPQSNWPGLLTLDKGEFLAMADHGGVNVVLMSLS